MEAIRQGDIPGVQLRRRVDLAGRKPAEVWSFWIDAEEQSRWLCDRARVEVGPPTVFWLESDLPAGGVLREYAEVVERVEFERLVLGFRQLDSGWKSATKVSVELSPAEAGCHVMVFQEGFQQLPLSTGLTAWENSRTRWSRALQRLAEIAS